MGIKVAFEIHDLSENVVHDNDTIEEGGYAASTYVLDQKGQ